MTTLIIKWCKFKSGERFPVLQDAATGLPLPLPTLFTVNELRARGDASNTIEACLRAILHLLTWAQGKAIDIDVRCREGTLLHGGEIDSLIDACKKPLTALRPTNVSHVPKRPMHITNVFSLARKRPAGRNNVSKHTACVRLLYIHKYLKWRTNCLIDGFPISHPQYLVNLEKRKTFLESLYAKIPRTSRRALSMREGLDEQVLSTLISATKVDSPSNPWRDMDVRVRNGLIVRMLLDLGIRRGELLGIEIRDINFRKNELTIHRTPDNKRDPRIREPNTKTLARVLPIGESLAAELHRYITRVRNKGTRARAHPLLFTSIDAGEPLSGASISKLFHILREKVEGLTPALSPHVLRHTWNELFSERMDENTTPEVDEQKLRSYLMGWKENSGTAATYLKRKIRRDAQKASIEYQQRLAQLRGKS